MSDLINGISQASQEQAQGVDQVNTAVAQMDRVTQQNASSAEESASAAEELAAQSQAVRGMVADLRRLIDGKGAGDDASSGMSKPTKTAKKSYHGPDYSDAKTKAPAAKREPVPAAANDFNPDEFASDDGEGLGDF